jgi:hypothetical protein
MAFIKRLGWYLVGVSIGLVFLAFILKKKSGEEGINFCYLPNCRVLKDIRSKTFSLANTNDTISFEKLDDEVKNILLNGNIDFGRSETKSKSCKTYFIVSENDSITMEIKNCPKKAIIEEISIQKK